MELNIPKLKQTFNVRYEFYNDNKIVKCFVTPQRRLEYLWADLYLWADVVSAHDADRECDGENCFWIGRAIFKSGDTMDIETAKAIARKKAMRSYYKSVKAKYMKVWKKIARIAAERLAYIEQAEAKASDLSLEIVKINKGENV